MSTVSVSQAFALAVQHHQAGRLREAETLYRQILAAQPGHAEALHHLGIFAHQAGDHERAVEWIQRSLVLNPNNAAAYSNLGAALAGKGEPDRAAAMFRRALELKPDYPEAHSNLGDILRNQGRLEEAADAYRQALLFDPRNPQTHFSLGRVLAGLQQRDAAMAAFRRALELQPDAPEMCDALGTALAEQEELELAVTAYRRALQLQPGFARAHNNLGTVLNTQGQLDAAIAAYRQALQLQPAFATAHYNLAVALNEQGHLDVAVTAYREALRLNPDFTEAWSNLGNALRNRGELEEAFTAYRRAIALRADHAMALSNLIFGLQFLPAHDERSIRQEQARWNRLHVDPLRPSWRPHDNSRDPARRLKIGYVSPDFRFHPVAFFLAPLLEAHDHRACEIYCYSTVERPDSVTDRLRRSADVWRDVRLLSDAQLAETMRRDGINILVDLAMHTAGSRLPAFAHRPAPIQVSWLAYPGSTGMEAIDYRISDRWLESEIEDGASEFASAQGAAISDLPTPTSELAMRLPDAWCCYAPMVEFPQVGPLPAEQNKTVTFGSLNQFCKVPEGLLGVWARLLVMVPASRLIMICPEGQAHERTLAQFAARGVTRERVELIPIRPWRDYVRLFERIDLALDSFPCNGMTSTCHALWMGVPVVTRAGTSAVSRAGASLLRTVGLPELVASSEDEYLRLAAEWAGDLPRLAELRRTLRPRMAASPLMDAPRFAGHLEAAYRTMWQHWCDGPA